VKRQYLELAGTIAESCYKPPTVKEKNGTKSTSVWSVANIHLSRDFTKNVSVAQYFSMLFF